MMPALQRTTDRLITLTRGQSGLTRLMVLTVSVFVLFSILSPEVFFSVINFQTIAFSVPEVGLLGMAVMIAMLTGGIDLSIVAIANLTALTAASLYEAFDATNATGSRAVLLTVLFVLAGLVVAALAGAVNGLLVAVVGVTPILATLGTMQLFNGLAIVWTGGENLYGMPDAFLQLGIGTVAGVPVSFLVFSVIAVSLGVLVTRSPFGTRLRLVGANPKASRFSGIDNRGVLLRTYVLTGLLAGIAGIVIASRSASASADYGASYVLLAIVIAVLGGTNPFGGSGTVLGVVLATVILQMVSSGFNIMRLSPFKYIIAQGLILIVVMVLDIRQRERAARATPRQRPSDQTTGSDDAPSRAATSGPLR